MADLFGTYSKRIKLTIDNTKIDAELTWFPVTVFFTAAQGEEIFSEFDADSDYMKCAFTKSDGVTQLYAEMELFDHSENTAIYHVSLDGWTIASGTDTDFYYYYDNDADDNTNYISAIDTVASISGDDFTGDDTDPLDSLLWSTGASTEINSNKARCDGTGTDNISKFRLAGDFDIEIGWEHISGYGAGARNYFRVYYGTERAIIYREGDNDRVVATDGTNYEYITHNTSSGYFRILKSGTNISLYFKDLVGDGWTLRYTFSGYTAAGVFDVRFYSGGSLVVDYDDFVINSGTVIRNIASNVWDDNFKMVQHMADYSTSVILDSTFNRHNGIKKGTNEPVEAAGKVGQGQDFDGTDDYLATIDAADDLNITAELTLEAIIKPDGTLDSGLTDYKGIIDRQTTPNVVDSYALLINADGKLHLGSSGGNIQSTKASWADGTNFYVAGTYESSGLSGNLYVDGIAEVLTNDAYDAMAGGSNSITIGINNLTSPNRFFPGVIDEVRISATERSAAWIKATYNSLWDTLLTYGAEESLTHYTFDAGAGSYSLTGTNAEVLRDSVFGASAGAYALTGSDIDLNVGKIFLAGSGSYAITGTNAQVLKDSIMSVGSGSYALTGKDIDFTKNYPFSVGSGSYAITGQEISLLHDKVMAAGSGSYALTGTSAEILRIIILTVGAGSYALTGSDLTFVYMPIVYDDDLGWKADRNLGAWDFTEAPDKFGYLNNKNWSKLSEVVAFCTPLNLQIDKENKHLPCGHWHKTTGGTYTSIVRTSVNTGPWVAAMPQPGTAYIYLYDTSYKAVIKIEAANPPLLKEILPLSSLYSLDETEGFGNPGAQRGGYCMNKAGTTIWYLFRTGSDCQLIEVDISGATMSITRKTTFAGLCGSVIADGCDDNTYTYWCTDAANGQIIRITNSDHSLKQNKFFNYPVAHADAFNTGITSIDVDVDNNKIYWCYSRSNYPIANCIQHLIRYDGTETDLDQPVEVDHTESGSGFATPGNSNMVRVIDGYLWHHRAYYPPYGNLYKRNLACEKVSASAYESQKYLQNIYGIKGNNIYTNFHAASADHPSYLDCINTTTMNSVDSLDVSYYQGQVAVGGTPLDWEWNSVGAMADSVDIIVLVRWDAVKGKNYVSCFTANTNITFMCDEPLYYIETTSTVTTGNAELLSAEPQVWPM